MKLINLAKKLDFTNEIEYFDYCINSYENGNTQQCKKLFSDMTKKDRKRFIEYISGCYDNPQIKAVYRFYWGML